MVAWTGIGSQARGTQIQSREARGGPMAPPPNLQFDPVSLGCSSSTCASKFAGNLGLIG